MNNSISRYGVVGVQTAFHGARTKDEMKSNLERSMQLLEVACMAYGNLGFPIKLVVFPEYGIHALSMEKMLSAKTTIDSGLAVTIPGEETEFLAEAAKKFDCYIFAGSWMEYDPKWPTHIFNTVPVVGPEGYVGKYRKVQPWVPLETTTSPLYLENYDEELFPVFDLPIGKIATAVCYDFIFPEILREYTFKGAEVLVRASAYPHPFTTERPMNWWDTVSQVRSLENVCYGVHVNLGSTTREGMISFPGGTCIVDYEGRILSQIRESGEHIVYGTIDIDSLRAWRATTYTHLMPAHLHTEAFTYMKKEAFPPTAFGKEEEIAADKIKRLIDQARGKLYSS